MDPSIYLNNHGKKFESSLVTSYTSIQVLPELTGKEWDEVALAYVSGLNPSYIRVTNGEVTCDAMTGRVTVFINDNKIYKIYQEVRISLPDNIKNGYTLQMALKYGKESKEFKFFNDDDAKSFLYFDNNCLKHKIDDTIEYLHEIK